ncbi:hypothetical protein BIY24_10595 [Halobacteriovorax marinus]|uniref:YbjQ family protein n=1 Tax=Halobacteriovorax marinus TaxID=97084 RepID=UPI000BC2D2DE|nr:heavy metal-binding domain-containing protein [Halobacteriovorax marinus]ATH08379.1 hypothetical protein BIY24_10595 [Halobacteriovorax marinus]
MSSLTVFSILLFSGYFIGKYNEERHIRSIRARERSTRRMSLNNLKKVNYNNENILQEKLAIGSTVVSIDYFKLITTGFKSLFGGRLKGIESLVDRARREAVLRMKEDAIDYDTICNVRIETSSISNDIAKRYVGSIEVIAYGTAIKFKV